MSLVQLSHICSHLQNASLARLGLTSIPYTKLHLSLALLLQKQGFLSQVKLGGPSPPASVFGPGPRDNHHVTNYPHGASGRNRHSAEAALALLVRKGYSSEQLQSLGFPQEAIDFANQHGRRSLEELERLGWAQQIPRFISDLRAQVDALVEERESQFLRQRDEFEQIDSAVEAQRRITLLEEKAGATPEARKDNVLRDVLAGRPVEQQAIYRKFGQLPLHELESMRFDLDTLNSIAGKNSFLSEREIKLNGITVEAMGLPVSNQSVTLPVEDFQDPSHMETEGIVTQENRASRRLWLGLKYYESKPVISKAQMISKPTKRVWLNSRDLGRIVRGGQAGEVKPLTRVGEIMAVSTDRGLMEARECVERQIGGQPLCRVW
ncbi:Putative ribosomal protein S8 [Septoria linicola]|uniref:Ribosomal protein S8 n=1 Tax=Septoria linicola TaxID=215465 RepID=A0A9Q9AJD8_9PEZI|nr:putative ribosomal protein S8 [Septoria linicola]USW47530.1 Putative ribosomal protein S8 [Septoria linicola]